MEAGQAKLVAESSCMSYRTSPEHLTVGIGVAQLILMQASKLTDPKG